MVEELNKREVLRGMSRMGELLRGHPEIFTMRGDEEHMPTTQIRLNSLGKVLNIGTALITNYQDGSKLEGDLKEFHSQYIRLLNECMKPYQ